MSKFNKDYFKHFHLVGKHVMDDFRRFNINELREVLSLMEHQETNERYTNTSINIDGNYANITVDIDEDGNITVL